MIRGITLMKCTECGKRFKAPDIEWHATIYSAPCKCPKCGSIKTRPSHLVNPFVSTKVYEKMWKQIDDMKKVFDESHFRDASTKDIPSSIYTH